MSKTYELRTLKDIFDTVPPDKWELLFSELLAMFKEADGQRKLFQDLSEIVGVSPDTVYIDELIVWKDDGKTERTTVITTESGTPVMEFVTN